MTFFVQKEIENGEFRGKTLEVPEVPQTSLWGSFPSCHWLMALDDGGVVTVPLNLAQGSLLFYMHVYIFLVVVGKVGKDIIFR